MCIKISICCCNSLFCEAIKGIITQAIPAIDAKVTCYANHEKVLDVIPALLISDSQTFSRIIALDNLPAHKLKILLIGTCYQSLIQKDYLVQFIAKGLMGILSPTAGSSELMKAITSILSGELWFERRRLNDIIEGISTDQSASSLTKKEKEIVRFICKGFRNKEIVQQLKISEQAVKSHLTRINKKCGVSDRLQLALYANKHWPDLSHSKTMD